MSGNIRGITFAEQTVTPADDAIVRRAILGDGILTGCEVSYSGSTLTMAAGYIIACGRAFQITAAQNWAVVDATSGFARLLVTLDLTKTATEETFGQIEFSLEYAASEDGFLALVQEDINLSGAKYQIVAAVVSLGTGGITGIVSKLEKAEGGGLNFKVVAGLTQPVSATENTIWVNTEKMTGWIFDANQPENLDEGMVWLKVGNSGTSAFNALKKNGLRVYPISAKQNVNGALIDKEAMTYQNGQWVDWIPEGALFWHGDEFVSLTGGWQVVEKEGEIGGTVAIEGGELLIDGTSTRVSAVAMCRALDSGFLSKKTYVRARVTDVVFNHETSVCRLYVYRDMSADGQAVLGETKIDGPGEYKIPLNAVTSGQPGIAAYRALIKASEVEVV